MSEGKVTNFVLNPIGNQEKIFKKHYIKCLENSFLWFFCEDEGEGKSRGTGSYGIFKKMRQGGAKSCKNGLGRDNEIYFGRRITTNFMVGLGRRNKEFNV